MVPGAAFGHASNDAAFTLHEHAAMRDDIAMATAFHSMQSNFL